MKFFKFFLFLKPKNFNNFVFGIIRLFTVYYSLFIILFLIFFVQTYFFPVFCQEKGAGIETKISIDKSMEERVLKVLKEITGTDKLIVIVNTELYTEKEKKEIKLTPKEERPQFVLPGVPVKENIGERKIEDLLAPLDLGETKTWIKRMTATIIIDKSVPDAVIEIAKKVAGGLLGIIPARGDQLVFERMSFIKNPFTWSSLLYPPHIFWIIGIFLTSLFVFGSIIFFFNPFKSFSKNFISAIVNYLSQQQARTSESEIINPREQLNIAGINPANPLSQTTTEGEKKHFYFVNEINLNPILTILKSEPAQNIAITLNYLNPNFSSYIFSNLTSSQQAEVTLQMSAMQEVDPDVVKLVENKIKTKLDYTLGSEDSIVNLLTYIDKTTQSKILLLLKQSNPNMAQKLEKTLISFDDMINFDTPTIQAIVRRTNLANFAQMLNASSEEFKNKIVSSLPEGTQKRVQQEIELGKPFPQNRLNEEKRRMVDLIRHLQAEGIIEIKK